MANNKAISRRKKKENFPHRLEHDIKAFTLLRKEYECHRDYLGALIDLPLDMQTALFEKGVDTWYAKFGIRTFLEFQQNQEEQFRLASDAVLFFGELVKHLHIVKRDVEWLRKRT